MTVVPYNRAAAVSYAHAWAHGRNPAYYDFEQLGGDCTSFASQVLFAGSGVMNYTQTLGWYYTSLANRSPSWTGVIFLYNFLTTNAKAGPFGRVAPLSSAMKGDVVQIATIQENFHHTPVIVDVLPRQGEITADRILVAAHSDDCDMRPLSSYAYHKLRIIHIDGVRK